jgi:predicted AAA+ superfamily ATPase
MNDYDAYDDDYADNSHQNNNMTIMNDMLHLTNERQQPEVDFDEPSIAALPRILLMGPRRAGKTSIQVLF